MSNQNILNTFNTLMVYEFDFICKFMIIENVLYVSYCKDQLWKICTIYDLFNLLPKKYKCLFENLENTLHLLTCFIKKMKTIDAAKLNAKLHLFNIYNVNNETGYAVDLLNGNVIEQNKENFATIYTGWSETQYDENNFKRYTIASYKKSNTNLDLFLSYYFPERDTLGDFLSFIHFSLLGQNNKILVLNNYDSECCMPLLIYFLQDFLGPMYSSKLTNSQLENKHLQNKRILIYNTNDNYTLEDSLINNCTSKPCLINDYETNTHFEFLASLLIITNKPTNIKNCKIINISKFNGSNYNYHKEETKFIKSYFTKSKLNHMKSSFLTWIINYKQFY